MGAHYSAVLHDGQSIVSMPLADTSPVDWPRKWQAALGSWTTLTPNLFSHINAFFVYLCVTLMAVSALA